MGEVTMTASALFLLLERNVAVNFMNYFGQFRGQLSPPLSKNSLLRLAQHQAHHDLAKRAELARRFVVGKLANQRALLQRYNRRLNDPGIGQEIDTLAGVVRKLAALSLAGPASGQEGAILATGDTGIAGSLIETILGLEGAGSAAYFRCFDKLLADQTPWQFAGRVKRPATDPVNALLSFGYALLTNQIASVVQVVGFDPFVGYLHSSVYGRPALALDLMEEFRPIIVDSVVLTVLNNRMLKLDDFVNELGAYRLKPEARKLFLTKFEERLNEEIQHPVFGYRVKYRRCFELQARLVVKYLTGETAEYPPFTVR
jgi:CRISPR-associated protein Cas1